MKNIALHLLDLIENSVKAGASEVRIRFALKEPSALVFLVTDNGPGFPDAIGDPFHPFNTDRKERRVGLGLSLLHCACRAVDGICTAKNGKNGGVEVYAEFNLHHIDMKPPGDIVGVLEEVCVMYPEINLTVKIDNSDAAFSGEEIRKEIGRACFCEPSTLRFIHKQLKELLDPLMTKADEAFRCAPRILQPTSDWRKKHERP